MKTRDLLIGAAAGAAAVYLIKEAADRQNRLVPADEVLKQIKAAFKQEGPIDGSWIMMKPEPYKQHAVSTDVYRGGITRHHQDELEQYEFLADAYTGAVIDVKKQ